MRDVNERPVCHRAEDLVTYLYGEANEVDALDFRNHLQQCDACRSEFAVFNQVHESISVWRHEALGSSFNPALPASEPAINSTQLPYPERKLSALAALREFFSVSPLWLRGATAFAGLLLCVLVVLAISRSWQQPTQIAGQNNEPKRTQAEFDAAVAREVKIQTEKIQQASAPKPIEATQPQTQSPRNEVAGAQRSGKQRVKGLTRQEQEQLAADLRLVPSTDDEGLPFVLSDQPND